MGLWQILILTLLFVSQTVLGSNNKTKHLVSDKDQKTYFDVEKLEKAQAAVVNTQDIKNSKIPPAVEFVIDSSGSMGQILEKNKSKMYFLKKLMEANLTAYWKKEAYYGLKIYGGTKKQDCSDIIQAVPQGRNTLGQISKRIENSEPVGMTPIHESIKLSYESVKKYKGPKRIIVVTDGEDTCGGHPCQTAQELKSKDLDLEFFVVALGFKGDSEALKKVQCIGETFVADSESSLSEAMNQVRNRVNERNNLKVISPNPDSPVYLYQIKDGKKILFKTFYARSEISVPPGRYTAVVGITPLYSFGEFEIPPHKKITLAVEGTGEVLIRYFGQNLNVELLDKNLKAVARFKSDTPTRAPIGQWQLRIFRGPFFEKIQNPFFVYPDGKHEIEVNNVGVIRIEDSLVRGLYIFDQEKNLLGQHLTNQTLVLKASTYTIHVDDKCQFEGVPVRDQKDVLILPCLKER